MNSVAGEITLIYFYAFTGETDQKLYFILRKNVEQCLSRLIHKIQITYYFDETLSNIFKIGFTFRAYR